MWVFVCLSFASYGQKNGYFIFSGTINDAETKAPLEGASVLFSGLSIGARTDSVGFFSLTLPSRTYQMVFRSLGYKIKTGKIDLKANARMDIFLLKQEQLLDEVVITTEKADANVNRTIWGSKKCRAKRLKNYPI